jgi:glycogen debranching enzyme
MTVRITVGRPVLTINKGNTFVVTDHGGEIDPHQAQGVFADDTRFVSSYQLWVNGQRWERLSSAAVSYSYARVFLTNPVLEHLTAGSPLPPGVLGLDIEREIDGGVHEQFDLTNYSMEPVRILLEVEMHCDFADLFEVRRDAVRRREAVVTEWDNRRHVLTTTYRNNDYLRRLRYQVVNADPPPTYANGRLLFSISLPPRGRWRACGHMSLQHGSKVRRPRNVCRDDGSARGHEDRTLSRWVASCTDLHSPNDDVTHAYRQAVEDMAALRLYDEDLGPDVWVPSAGVPWYVALFGRDSLIASLQTMMVNPRFAEGTLRTLARYQATERDDWRDAQPGKIVHEVRHGELSHFNLVPHARYYGTWDATALFLILLCDAWRWLGDRQLVEDLLPAAERCLEWIDRYGDLDGDGFQEYRTFSDQGYENMGWKDAHDAIVYPDGSQVVQPKGTCELQGYVFAAKQGMALLFDAFDRPADAERLRAEAAGLKRRFNEVFWMEDEGTYALGLDRDNQPIGTVASNAGHCLWSGIADPDKAARVCARLLQPDMWSGWGIRTLSSLNPAYNPFSYQCGSVWPHDNAIIAAGMKRYGFADAANRVARAMFDAAMNFESYRLPEVFAGLDRDPESFPVQYRGANVPQAWAAGSIFQLVQAMVGLRIDLARGVILVDPSLPDWLPRVELRGLPFGRRRLTLTAWREDDGCHVDVRSPRGAHARVRVEQARLCDE